MKRRLVISSPAFALLLAVALTPSVSQVRQVGGSHEARLSGHCQSIDTNETITLSMGDARVRRGGSAKAVGLRQAIFVEAGGSADVFGTASVVYVAKGGKATVGGERNQVISEQGGNVLLVGRALMTVVETIELQVHRNSTDCQ
jgi:hypothetical protein